MAAYARHPELPPIPIHVAYHEHSAARTPCPASCISTSSSERSIPRALHASHLRPLPPFHGRNSKRPSSSTTASFDEGSAPRIPQYSYPRPYLLPNARYPELPLVPIHDRVSSRTLGTQNSPPVPIYIDDCILTLDAESSPPVPGPRPPTSARSHPHLWPNSATNIRHPELQPVLIHGQRPRLPYVRCPELATHLRPPSRAVNSPMNSRHPELPPIPIHGRVLPRNSPPIPVHDRIGRFFPRTLGTQNYNPSLSMAVLYRESSAPRAPTRSPTNAWHLKPSPTHPHPRPLPPESSPPILVHGRVLPRTLITQNSHPHPRMRPALNARHPELRTYLHPRLRPFTNALQPTFRGSPHPSPFMAVSSHDPWLPELPTYPNLRTRPPANARHQNSHPRPRPPTNTRHPELQPVPVYDRVFPRTFGTQSSNPSSSTFSPRTFGPSVLPGTLGT